jgi:phenylacetate-CoA ligase
VTVRCEVTPAHIDADRDRIAQELQQRIKTLTGVSTQVQVGLPDAIERTLVGKARRVVDNRPK